MIKFFSINNSTSNTSFPEVLRRWVKPINLKLYHATGAMLVFMLAMATVALACYSNWFKNRVEGRVEYRIDMNIKLPWTNSKLQPNPGLSSFFAIFQDGFGDFVSGPRLSLQFAWLGKWLSRICQESWKKGRVNSTPKPVGFRAALTQNWRKRRLRSRPNLWTPPPQPQLPKEKSPSLRRAFKKQIDYRNTQCSKSFRHE